ncbi:MAG: protein-disulfide reductase DsbD [Chitinivibrionia bacterium]|nr:protein-disulfide reductase DsbD [Chitinivibrionia bacterium]
MKSLRPAIWIAGIGSCLVALTLVGVALAQMDLSAPITEASPVVVKSRSVLSISEAPIGGTVAAAVVAEIDSAWHINSAAPYQEWLIPAQVRFGTIEGASPHDVQYPAGHDVFLMDETMSVYSGQVVIPFQLTIAPPVGDSIELPVEFTFQACDNKTCQPPETVTLPLIIPIGSGGVAINQDVFSAPTSSTTEETNKHVPADVTSGQENDLQRLIEGYGFWGYFLALGLAFFTGLLLSFSPCTYPMIPITVSIFAGQDRSVGRGFVLSLFYVGSMAVIYGAMGLVVSLVGGVFGSWLASPPVVIGIAVVFVVFALSMFGLYELQVPMALRQRLGTRRGGGGVLGAMILGVVAALVVSPCVGPFVAGILLYVATSGSPVIGFLVLFVFALGLGTLFVIIGTFSSAMKSMPHSGEWMESVKKFFGFVLVLMAIYFLRTILPETMTALLTSLLLLAFGVFGGGMDRLEMSSGFFPRLKKFLGLIALVIGVYLMVALLLSEGFILSPSSRWLPSSGNSASSSSTSLIAWNHDLSEGLQRAQAEHRPVLIDTWATWCANCRVLEKRTFGDPAVAAEASRFVPIKVQLETADSETSRDFMQRFSLRHYSLPTTLLLDSDGRVAKILQGVVSSEEMISHMQRVR